MLNQTVLTGNLGQDPEIFFTSEGDPIAKFSLAFKSSKKKTSWIKVACFGRLAEITEKHLHHTGQSRGTGPPAAGRKTGRPDARRRDGLAGNRRKARCASGGTTSHGRIGLPDHQDR